MNCIFSLTYNVEIEINNSIVIYSINSTGCIQDLCLINISIPVNTLNDYAVEIYQINEVNQEKLLVSSISLSKCLKFRHYFTMYI